MQTDVTLKLHLARMGGGRPLGDHYLLYILFLFHDMPLRQFCISNYIYITFKADTIHPSIKPKIF